MTAKVVVKVTSERPCVMNVLGEFEAGETKEFTNEDGTYQLFQSFYGYPIGAMRLPSWMSAEIQLHTSEEIDSTPEKTEEA